MKSLCKSILVKKKKTNSQTATSGRHMWANVTKGIIIQISDFQIVHNYYSSENRAVSTECWYPSDILKL